MDTITRLHTEEKENLAELAGKYFEGVTLYRATGFWQGVKEKATIIEVIGNGHTWESMILLAKEINKANDQQACLIVQQNLKTGLGQTRLVTERIK